MPLVSVCVITYNQRQYIERCLKGILSQKTDFDFEVLIGEDGGIDGTYELCLQYQEKYPDKIKLFRRSRNDVIYIDGGATGRFNLIETLKAAQGKYIAVCEGDDYWIDDNKLQKQIDFLENNDEYVLCFHPVLELRDGKTTLSSIDKVLQGDSFSLADIAKRNMTHTMSIVFRNHLFTEFPAWYYQAPIGDYPLYMVLAQYGKFKYLRGEVLAVYRLHSGFWSSMNEIERYKRYLKMLNLFIDAFKQDEAVLQNLKIQYGTYSYDLALTYHQANDADNYKIHLTNAMLLAPDYVQEKLTLYINENKMLRNSLSLKIGNSVLKPFKTFKKKK